MAGYATYDPTTTSPSKIASQNRNLIYGQAQNLTTQQQQAQQQAQAQSGQTQDYLGGIEDPLAQGNGGYNADETSQIELSPQDEQNIVNGAGISAGVNTAASVGAAQRATAAAGGNPEALMAYRARAAQQQGVQTGNAMTAAKVAAKTAEQTGAEAVGNARIGQQNQALGYYGGLQSEQNQNAQQDLGLQNQTYGTETSGLTGSANTAQSASQNPTGFDKTIGAVTGVLGALADGSVPTGGSDAVVGEDGPEKVVQIGDYMGDGGLAGAPAEGVPMDDDQAPGAPLPPTPSAPSAGGNQPWWKKLMSQPTDGTAQPQQQKPWTPVSTYSNIGKDVGNVAKLFMADGGTAQQGRNGIFTKPTHISLAPDEAVVPLSYRAGAKIRPSMAALPAARTRQPYGASA